MNSKQDKLTRCTPTCGCHSEINRRDLLRIAGTGALAWSVSGLSAMAGPFQDSDFEKLVPRDKKLQPEWVKSLFERGQPEVYTGQDLELIGMPVGGLCAGQLYLGGDGRLWHWDIFNLPIHTGAEHYANPLSPKSPLDQGFAIRVNEEVRSLDSSGFEDIKFCGEYPLARMEYRDAKLPVTVSLEAFSPFIPLNCDDSSLPATVMRFTVKNSGAATAKVELAGWLENAVCLYTGTPSALLHHNRIVRTPDLLRLDCSGSEPPRDRDQQQVRPDIVWENWEAETYQGWTAEGVAFGRGPILKSDIPAYQGDVGGPGTRVANSHSSAPGNDVGEKDNQTGTLTSKEFQIERKYINFWVGGGSHVGKTCLNLLVDGQVVATTTGRSDNKMRADSFDVQHLQGKSARLQIVDSQAGPWGNIGVGEIVHSDKPAQAVAKLQERHDFGTLTLGMLEPGEQDRAVASLPHAAVPAGLFGTVAAHDDATEPFGRQLRGGLCRSRTLAAGEDMTVTFVITWHFPNDSVDGVRDTGRYYAQRFADAGAVAEYVSTHFSSLYQQTRLWHDTWYDSTLPYWFLDRTFLNTSILASSTCHRFATGRFYGWEGVGCCAGTCTHVWQYAQAVARVFPELERDLRERTDFGIAFDAATGIIRFRAEGAGLAVDGQSGCVLRSYREHQMSPDDQFLTRNWAKIKRSLQCLIDKDGDANGILESGQHNTLDADWYGPVAWLSGMYLAALRAGQQMAQEVGDEPFADVCGQILAIGQQNIVSGLFEGEYFINKPDPGHPEAINSGTGCEIDQVLGQSWAWQVGLGRVLPEQETRLALQSLWRYNFTPDVGPYREANKPGRWYAMPGEAGLLMCTFPRNDWDYKKAAGKGAEWAAGYFNECMNGFEYQAAGHMIWEGQVQEGLAVARAVHDRYHPARRNPWNEVECGDHYARSMASYGVFLAACGFAYHGPQGSLGFAPRLTPEDFRAAFTAAEGWGTYRQQIVGQQLSATIQLQWGSLAVRTLTFDCPQEPLSVRVKVNGQAVAVTSKFEQQRVMIDLGEMQRIEAGQSIEVEI